MKQFLHCNLRKSNLICIGLYCILLCIVLMIGIIDGARQSIGEVNNNLSNNYVPFEMHGSTSTIIKKLMDEENIILRNGNGIIFGQGMDTEGLYFNGKYNNSYKMLEGRFFETSDFNSNNKFVVIGKEAVDKTKVENSKKYIYRGNVRYEVIGIIGKENEISRYDNLLIYNLDSITDKIPTSNWIVDSLEKSESQLNQILNKINNEEGDSIHIEYKDEIPNPLKKAIEEKKSLISNFIIIIMCILISLTRAIVFWINNISNELAIRSATGATKKQIYWIIIKRYLIISLISCLITIISCVSIKFFDIVDNIKITINIISIGLPLITVIVIGAVTILISLFKINKIQVADRLKGKWNEI